MAGVPSADIQKSTIEGVLGICSLAWSRLSHEIFPEDVPACDHVFLESQPRVNAKMQHVYFTLQSFLIGKWDERGCRPTFHRVSPARKLAEADFAEFQAGSNKARAVELGRKRTSQELRQDKGKKYRENKKHAKLFTPILLREIAEGGDVHASWFESQGFKRDDLADAMLQAYYMGMQL